MGTALLYLLLAVTPAAVLWAAGKGVERMVLGPRARPAATAAATAERSLQRLVADLRRLEGEYARIQRAQEPGRATRLRAVGLAYDDTLTACCRAVGLPAPSAPPLSALSRLHTEAALAQAGVTW